MSRSLVLAPALLGLLLAVACARPPLVEEPSPIVPSAWRDWALASDQVERLEAQGQPQAADSTLEDFIRRWPGTPEAEEGTWWRILRQAELAEDSTSTALVVARIDSLLAGAPAAARRVELRVLRRTLALTQLLRSERDATRAERDTARQRAGEIDKLRAELEEARAELVRVRNRVIRRRP